MVDPITISAIGWGMTALNWLMSPILSRLINKCFNTLGVDLPKSLQHLETTLLPELKIIMEAAQQSQHRSTLEKWLEKLKEAFYEAEDILDLVEYERLEKEVKSKSSSNILLPLKTHFFSPQKKKLLKSLQKFEKLVNEAREFVPLFNLPNSSNSNATTSRFKPYMETTSSPPLLVIGRDEDRDKIIKLLREDSPESSHNSNCFSVIGIYGIGGMGKTTLVQCVYEYEQEAKYFDLVMWVYISREFSVHTILSKLYESAYDKSCEDFKNLDVLQNKIKEQLRGKKFLLVMDDVWCNKGELDHLFSTLRLGKKGSKILVTTRMEDVAKTLGASNPIQLRELEHGQFSTLFMHYALGHELTNDENLEKELKLIGEKVAEKLHKSPLAARIVAGQLSKRLDPTFWSYMLRKDLLTDSMGVLYLSYQYLDPKLQRCFAFFSLFPKGYLFKDDELLEYWIAEKFIEIGHEDEHVRDVARHYLHELLSNSFLSHERKKWSYENSVHDEYSVRDEYSVHDLLHDLAEMVTKNEYFRIEDGERKEIPTRVKHLFVGVDLQRQHIENICKLQGLRTIILENHPNLKYNDLDTLFMKLKKLRVVLVWHVHGSGSITSIPESVAYLKHLRYLQFYSIKEKISKRFNQLYHMCFLHTSKNISDVPYFGRLRSIQTIRYFSVTKNKGTELKQIENLRELYGSLVISNLQNVAIKEEALAAQLSNKHGIKRLRYSWDFVENEGDKRNKDVEILEGLDPPPDIADISICGYQGERYPSWISQINHSANNLRFLEFEKCDYLKTLPESLELHSHLRCLSIKNLPRLRRWQPLPTTLTTLFIDKCFSLAFISKEELETVMSIRSTQMPKVVTFINDSFDLASHTKRHFEVVENMVKANDYITDQTLSLTDPNDLQNWLGKRFDLIWQLGDTNKKLILPSSLESLKINSCPLTNSILWKGLQGATSLTNLYLRDIVTITSIPMEVLSSVNKLQKLEIIDCLFLKSLGGFETLESLKKLEIKNCPILTLDKVPSSLEYLKIELWRPPDDIFGGLVLLKKLDVDGCPSIVSPHIGCSKLLETVSFNNCSNLNSIRGLSELPNHVSFGVSVSGCPMLTCQPMDEKLCMPSISLCIDELSLVQNLLEREAIESLQSLTLYLLPRVCIEAEFMEVFQHLSALTTLIFSYCMIDFLPSSIASLSSLKELEIDSCGGLSVLPNLPISLEKIVIRWCNLEFVKSCKESGHPNCIKLANIPEKEFDP